MRIAVFTLSLAALSFAVGGCCMHREIDQDEYPAMHGNAHAMHDGMHKHKGHDEDSDDDDRGEHKGHEGKSPMDHMDHMGAVSPLLSAVHEAVAVIYPTKGNSVSGTITFTQSGDGLHIHGTVTGLEPNSTHAIHIHEFGDQTSDNGSSAGGHYNPEHHAHGAPDGAEHHAGDLGNLKADANGSATVDLTVHDISIASTEDPIIGRGVVIHQKADDFGQPVGNAGGRIGVGVIGVKMVPPAP